MWLNSVLGRWKFIGILGIIMSLLVVQVSQSGSAKGSAKGQTFDFDQGNAAIEVVIPTVIPAIYESVSSNANDPTLVFRITTLVTNAWFDAIAPYHPTAVGIYSNLDRLPEDERTDRNKNVALIYASHRVLNGLLPQHKEDWDNMLLSVGLEPNPAEDKMTNAIRVGQMAGDAIATARENDGMNQLGNEGGHKYNLQPYADTTGYQPVNTAYELRDPSRWQPAFVATGKGAFRIQQFVTPQMKDTLPYTLDNLNKFTVERPINSIPTGPKGMQLYKDQADEVLEVSANLTDEQKMMAEFFDNKLNSLGFSGVFAAQSNGLSLDEFIHYDFLVNVAAFDTAIAVWSEKYK